MQNIYVRHLEQEAVCPGLQPDEGRAVEVERPARVGVSGSEAPAQGRHDGCGPRHDPRSIACEVIYVDRFGNLMSNIPRETPTLDDHPKCVHVAGMEVPRIVRTYSDVEPNALIALVSRGE
jgi:hypothetical protein